MSNRLTFSLASLILIFALVFVATPAMAATGGPTVTIAHGQAAAKQTRAVFKLKFTFDVAVTGFEAGDATYQYYAKDGMPLGNVEPITPVAVTNKPAEYTVDLDLSSPAADAVGIIVVVNADGATGNNALSSKHGITNQAKSMRFDLPPEYIGKVEIVAKKDATDTDTSDGQDYDLTFTFKDTHATAGVEPDPPLTAALVTVEPTYVTTEVTLGTDTGDSATSGKDWVYKGSITHPMGAPTLTIGLVTSYVKAADVTTAMVPPADDMSVMATAEIEIDTDLPVLDPMQFKISVTFAGGKDSKGMDEPVKVPDDFYTMVKGTDSNGNAVSFAQITPVARIVSDNMYTEILQYNVLYTPPITVKLMSGGTADKPTYYMDTSDPTMAAMGTVGMAALTAPAAPTNVTATANQTTNIVTLTWTASEGATGYKIAQTMGADTVDYTATASPFMTPALTPGTYMFTVMATNDAGDSPASSPAATATINAPVVMVPGPPTGVGAKADQAANTIAITWTAPASDGGSAITGYTVTKHYMKNGVAATKDFSATASPLTIPPTGEMLPQGVNFTFTVKAMNSVGTGPESVPSAAVMINMDPVAPGAPTDVTATADQAANTVLITWTAPADDGGSAITSYTITQTGAANKSYTALASANSHTTDALTVGAYAFTVMATNSAGDSPASSPAATATINADPPPVVIPPGPTPPTPPTFGLQRVTVPPLTVGTPISMGTGPAAKSYIPLPRATGGTGDLEYSMWVGVKDITFSGYNGLSVDLTIPGLTGTPLAPYPTGTQFEWRATDKNGLSAKVPFVVVVNPKPTGPVPPTPDTVITVKKKTTNLVDWRIGSPGEFKIGRNETSFELTLSSATAIADINSAVGIWRHDRDTDRFSWIINPDAVANSWTLRVGVATGSVRNSSIFVRPGTGYKLQTPDLYSTQNKDIAQFEVIVDAEGPEIYSADPYNAIPPAGGAFYISILFNEALKAAPTAANFTITNGKISEITASSPVDRDGRPNYRALITPNHGVGPTAVATKQNVEVRLNAGLADQFGNPSYGTAAHLAPDATFKIQKATTPGPTPPTPAPHGTITATLNAAQTESTLSGTIAANGFGVVRAAGLPDLEEFFDIGGTIGLHDVDTADGDDDNSREVIISEILWGLDFGAAVIADQKQWQFIELYNTTNAPIVVDGWMLKFTEGRPVPKKDVDQVSNRDGAGWDVDIGQSGRVTNTRATDPEATVTAINIVSMYRNINYDKVEKVKADGTADPSREEQLKGIPGGNGKGSWKASTRRDPNTPDGVGVTGAAAARWVYSTRGREHYTTTAILTASSVSGNFRINEIGNDTGSDNDWVELHNVTDSEQSLKNYQLTAVTAKGTDTELHDFNDKDWKVSAKGFVVISTRHPSDTDLAAGKDITIADDQEENPGASHLFVVRPVNLPDDGKFTLILRNAHDKEKSDANLVDVVATRQGSFADSAIGTSIWPLKATGQPHENVIDGGDENFAAGKVYQRNSGNGRGEKQFAVRGYTGIGYDRAAAATGANGGTPGYDNGAVKEKIADITTGEITISEIMADTGEARQNLAQWIELYNSSMTQSVNLNGWKLQLENAATNGELETNTFSATITLDAMTISPNQTVLIATTSGRVSDADHFPSSRVVNLWTTKKHRDALEMARRTDPVLSSTGFHLKLTDKDGKLVDEGGNLDGNRRTRDDIAWALPASEDDGRRSSMIRVYDNGVAVDGTIADGWVSADATNLAYAISHTFYGEADDFGTPGFRGGGPVPVRLSKFRPERLDDGTIVVRWITESELNNAGFNVLRSDTRNGAYTQLNTSLIAGQGTTSERTTYAFPDTSAKPNVVYYYQIQDVSLDGNVTTLRQSRLKGDISAAGKLTTTWGELKALQ